MEASPAKKFQWYVESLSHSILEGFLRLLPAPLVFRFGELAGSLIWPFIPKRQRCIERNLRIVFGEDKSPGEVRKIAKSSFIRTTANLVSSTSCKDISDEALSEMLTVENPEVLEKALEKGRGVILLLSHMGNWELLTRMHRLFPPGTPSGAFYRPLNNPILDERVRRLREADGTRLFSKRDSLHYVSGFLREGAVIGILTDQRVGRQGELAEFFGRITRASPLPSLLVRRCKSEVLSLSLKTNGLGKWVVKYHTVEKPYHTENCMAALEAAMRESIEDVFWLQERWKLYLRSTLPPAAWLKKAEARGEKPHRAVIWARSEEKELPLPEGYDHGDIEYETYVDRCPQDLPEIDDSKSLPIDFILAFSESAELKSAASALGIPVMFVPHLRSE